MSTDTIIAFQIGPPYHEWGILCVDCGAPGFDKELPRERFSFIPKPFSLQTLAEKVRTVLEAENK